MKTYEIQIKGEEVGEPTVTHFIKTDASTEEIQQTVQFVARGKRSIDGLLQGLRILGYKASEVKVEPVDVFEM